MIQSLRESRSMALVGAVLLLLSLGASSTVLATCETCNFETGECVSGNDFWCTRTVELEFDEDGNLVSRKVTCESGGSCDWGAPEY